MPKQIHPLAGALAVVTISLFWLSTAWSELFASQATITTVKSLIPWGFLILVPSLAIAGASGFRLGGSWKAALIARKKRRMRILAANGLLILIPSALYLASKAQSGAFDTGFYAVQTFELIAGAVNITLLALNMRDGLRMTRRIPPATK